MVLGRPRLLRPRARAARSVACAMLAAAMVATSAGSGTAASSGSVVGATVPSATDLVPGYCPPGTPGTTIGAVPQNSGAVTTADCSITFGSSNDSSQMRMYQADGLGRAMYRPVDGSPDTAFSSDGAQTIAGLGGYDAARYPGGGFVTTGETNFSNWQFEVARVNDDGTVAWRAQHVQAGCVACMATDVTALADGDIVAAGEFETGAGLELALMRLTNTGALRGSFGGGYVRLTRAGTQRAFAVVEQPGLGIVAAGEDQDNAIVVRYRDDGTLDTTFGTAGIISIDLGGAHDIAYDLAIDGQGRILVAGQNGGSGTADIFVRRYSANGVLDTSFGTAGTTIIDADAAWVIWEDRVSLALHPRTGEIFVAGESQLSGGFNTIVAKLGVNGLPDGSFGTAGVADIDVTPGQWDQADDLVIEGDGRLLVAVQSGVDSSHAYALRLTATGARDTSFGTNGVRDLGGIGANGQYGIWMIQEFDGRVAFGGNNSVNRMATATIPDWQAGSADWGNGSMFGACLRSLVGTTADGTTWPVDGDLDCTAVGTDPWRAVTPVGAPAKVARISAAGTATANLRFGVRNGGSLPPGTYIAPVVIEVLAPNS